MKRPFAFAALLLSAPPLLHGAPPEVEKAFQTNTAFTVRPERLVIEPGREAVVEVTVTRAGYPVAGRWVVAAWDDERSLELRRVEPADAGLTNPSAQGRAALRTDAEGKARLVFRAVRPDPFVAVRLGSVHPITRHTEIERAVAVRIESAAARRRAPWIVLGLLILAFAWFRLLTPREGFALRFSWIVTGPWGSGPGMTPPLSWRLALGSWASAGLGLALLSGAARILPWDLALPALLAAALVLIRWRAAAAATLVPYVPLVLFPILLSALPEGWTASLPFFASTPFRVSLLVLTAVVPSALWIPVAVTWGFAEGAQSLWMFAGVLAAPWIHLLRARFFGPKAPVPGSAP